MSICWLLQVKRFQKQQLVNWRLLFYLQWVKEKQHPYRPWFSWFACTNFSSQDQTCLEVLLFIFFFFFSNICFFTGKGKKDSLEKRVYKEYKEEPKREPKSIYRANQPKPNKKEETPLIVTILSIQQRSNKETNIFV